MMSLVVRCEGQQSSRMQSGERTLSSSLLDVGQERKLESQPVIEQQEKVVEIAVQKEF